MKKKNSSNFLSKKNNRFIAMEKWEWLKQNGIFFFTTRNWIPFRNGAVMPQFIGSFFVDKKLST